jgi:DNA modification methylase
MTTEYEQFIESKRIVSLPSGFNVDASQINPMLFDWQNLAVRWGLRRGKAALFEDCGLGKTPQQLEWAKHVVRQSHGDVMVFAPLAVAQQTVNEGQKFGIDVNLCRTANDLKAGINITNYDRLHHFTDCEFAGIVADESSILKGQFGVTRMEITDFASSIPYRLACSATPAPNDFIELIYHAEFLGVMNEGEIKALFFTQDGNSSNKFRLRRNAEAAFWGWVASWAIAIRKPSDLGYSDEGFVLPKLNIHHIEVDCDPLNAGMLIPVEALSLNEQRAVNRATLDDRIAAVANLVNNTDHAWNIWCHTNPESEALAKVIEDAIEVTGSDDADVKEAGLMGFSTGRYLRLISKPTICAWGMNWQHCSHVVLASVSNSYEQFYQLIRRNYRFGQTKPVDVHIVASRGDKAIIENIERKERNAMKMFDEIVHKMQPYQDFSSVERQEVPYFEDVATGTDWTLYIGDSVKTIDRIASSSVGVSVFSPPFPGMYVYTNSPHDMGNVTNIDQMIEQFRFLMRKQLRVMMPGRSTFIHITQGVAQKARDGYIGLKDFRGKIIAMMEDEGWIYYGETVIDKDPQLKAMRTKDHGLMFKSLANDAAKMHCALPDFLLQFKKPGENPEPIRAGYSTKYDNPGGWVTSDEWILWARPVWYAEDYMPGTWREGYTGDACPYGIDETDVLNVAAARDTNDERHLCPLQLGVIDRVVKVWSNPGDLVYSPFAGSGSEGYVALKNHRRFVGGELKASYWKLAQRYLNAAIQERSQRTLFDFAEVDQPVAYTNGHATLELA